MASVRERNGMVFVLAFAFACGGTRTGGTTPTAAQSCGDRPLAVPIAPMTSKASDATKGTFALRADGTMLVDGKTLGRIVCDEVHDANGLVVAVVKPDGTVSGSLTTPGAKFEGDELVVDPRRPDALTMRMRVSEDGMVTTSVRGPGKESPALSFSYENGAAAKRAAILASLFQLYYLGATLSASAFTGPHQPP